MWPLLDLTCFAFYHQQNIEILLRRESINGGGESKDFKKAPVKPAINSHIQAASVGTGRRQTLYRLLISHDSWIALLLIHDAIH